MSTPVYLGWDYITWVYLDGGPAPVGHNTTSLAPKGQYRVGDYSKEHPHMQVVKVAPDFPGYAP